MDAISESQFVIAANQELVEHVTPQLHIDPIVLQVDAGTMTKTETQVDVSGDPMRIFSLGRRGTFHIPGTRVDIDIPVSHQSMLYRISSR